MRRVEKKKENMKVKGNRENNGIERELLNRRKKREKRSKMRPGKRRGHGRGQSGRKESSRMRGK